MEIQRSNSNQSIPPREAATPAVNVGPGAPSEASASSSAAGRPGQDAQRAAQTDSFKGVADQAAGTSAARSGDPAQQAFSIKEQRRQARAAQAERNAGPSEKPAQPEHPLLAEAGKALGLAAGVVVTEALALIPSWSKPLVDANGKPVQSIPGAERIGDHDIEKRHQEVVGPQITALDEKIPKGMIHDFVGGFGAGATEAPGASYRLEAKVEDAVTGLWKKLTGGQ